MDAVEARSWLTLDAAKKLLADCGQDFDALKKSAITKEFRPVTLNAKDNIDIKQQLRAFKSHNVIGKLDGSDPKLQDEYVIYTAHWDHLGVIPNCKAIRFLMAQSITRPVSPLLSSSQQRLQK